MAENKSEPPVRPKKLGKAKPLKSTNTQQEQFSSYDVAQKQNRKTETRQGMPKLGHKRKGVVLPDSMIKELKHRAVDLGVTDSELIERAVRAYLESEAPDS